MLNSVPNVLRSAVQYLVHGRKVAAAVQALHRWCFRVISVGNEPKCLVLNPLVFYDIGFGADVHGDRGVLEDRANPCHIQASLGRHVEVAEAV